MNNSKEITFKPHRTAAPFTAAKLSLILFPCSFHFSHHTYCTPYSPHPPLQTQQPLLSPKHLTATFFISVRAPLHMYRRREKSRGWKDILKHDLVKGYASSGLLCRFWMMETRCSTFIYEVCVRVCWTCLKQSEASV